MVTRLLLIDDDEDLCELIAASLTGAGFLVTTANNGRSGLRAFRDEQPDLVITDILMPDIEGIEVIMTIKATSNPPPILAISGGGILVGSEYLDIARELGADGTLAKPFRMSALVTKVLEMLGQDTADVAVTPRDHLRLVSADWMDVNPGFEDHYRSVGAHARA